MVDPIDFGGLFFGMFGFIALVYGLIGFLLPFLLIYVLGYVRRRRDEKPDPMLGAKVFLTLLLSIAAQIIIFGICLAVAEGMEDKPTATNFKTTAKSAPALSQSEKSARWNLAKGTVYGGAMAALYPTALYVLLRRRHRGPDPVLRSALGVNAIFTGLVFVGAVTSLMITLNLQTVPTTMNNQIALTVVYLIASLGFGAPLAFSSPKQVPIRNEPIAAAIAPSVNVTSPLASSAGS
jgi:hypothetical protein